MWGVKEASENYSVLLIVCMRGIYATGSILSRYWEISLFWTSTALVIPLSLAAQALNEDVISLCGCNSISVLFEQILASVCIAYSSCSRPELKLSNQLWYDGVQPVLSVLSAWMNGPVWFGVALFGMPIKTEVPGVRLWSDLTALGSSGLQNSAVKWGCEVLTSE